MSVNKVIEYWNNSSNKWYENADYYVDKIVENPKIAFPPSVFSFIERSFPSLKGLYICVPSSGDNTAVFAFYLLGAHVCSVDISENQIKNAKRIADERNWDIKFVCDNSISLSKINSDTFDLVYTSNGAHVWIPDLTSMYRNFNRILNDKGAYIFFETHPMIRPFDNSGTEIKIVKHYKETGPFPESGGIEYAWRIQDFINSLVHSGFEIMEMSEFHSSASDFIKYDYIYDSEEDRKKDNGRLYDWRQNPWAALPQCLALWLKKKNVIDSIKVSN